MLALGGTAKCEPRQGANDLNLVLIVFASLFGAGHGRSGVRNSIVQYARNVMYVQKCNINYMYSNIMSTLYV
jgi:hypothetical protein